MIDLKVLINIGAFKTCAAQHGVHADGWILTVKLAFFVASGLLRFGSESLPASRR
jgi:hypothetical protein